MEGVKNSVDKENNEECLDWHYVDPDEFKFGPTLSEPLVTFLKENFNIDDVDALSDDDYRDLLYKLVMIEADAIDESIVSGKPLSKYGDMAGSCATSMSFQYHEGGKRWKG